MGECRLSLLAFVGNLSAGQCIAGNVPHKTYAPIICFGLPRYFSKYLVECQERGLEIQKPDIIMASPPCYYFSNAFSAPKSLYVRKFGN
ncbi:unnamed protein product [marine sediment metagenome]|uniref:Uncharacterized protein n=1 Tax=marine sediment metagenome TaxID=412755 RepID=X1CQL7_9ZZZZ